VTVRVDEKARSKTNFVESPSGSWIKKYPGMTMAD
jgi:hypothetical protein